MNHKDEISVQRLHSQFQGLADEVNGWIEKGYEPFGILGSRSNALVQPMRLKSTQDSRKIKYVIVVGSGDTAVKAEHKISLGIEFEQRNGFVAYGTIVVIKEHSGAYNPKGWV